MSPIEVDVWRIVIGDERSTFETLASILSPDERSRAGRFLVRRAEAEFVTTRAALRVILAHYCHCDPRSVQLICGRNGKPALASSAGLTFSVSHSCGVSLVAVAWDVDIGVDVERIRDGIEYEQIAARNFCRCEIETMQGAAAAERPRWFYRYWTCKEAVSKVTGLGLAMPPERVCVTFAPVGTRANVRYEEAGKSAVFYAAELAVDPLYAAAIATTSSNFEVTLQDWKP